MKQRRLRLPQYRFLLAAIPVSVVAVSSASSRLTAQVTEVVNGTNGSSQEDAAAPVTMAYAVPEAPAFTFLGVNSSKVSRPTTPRDFAVDLLSSVDSAGKFVQGVAISATPWYYIPGFKISLSDYQGNPFKFIAANTQLSFATVQTAGDPRATDLGLGLRLTIFDAGDPMTDTMFVKDLREVLDSCKPQVPGQPRDAQLACAGAGAQRVREEWLNKNWNKGSLSAGFGGGWRFAESSLSKGSWLGWSGWLVGALPVPIGSRPRIQLLGQLQYDRREAFDTLPDSESLTYGCRALYGSPTLNLFLEVVGVRQIDSPEGLDDSTAQWSGGVEFRAASDLWLSTGFGGGIKDDADQVVVIANVRWGISSSRRGAG